MEALGFLCFGLPALLGWAVLYAIAPGFRSKLRKVAIAAAMVVALGAGLLLFTEFRDRPVLDAAQKGDVVALRRALDAGGSPNAGEGDETELAALLVAIERGDSRCVELLLRRGADPNVESEGQRPLELAGELHRPDLARLLKRFGARSQ